MTFDHWDRNTLRFLTHHLASVQRELRIATGFFTIQGYDLIRHAVQGKSVLLLVGFDETSTERLQQKLLDDVFAYLSRWDIEDRRIAVRALITALQEGHFRIAERKTLDWMDARIRSGDHAKLYILDDQLVLVGSSNLTVSGLRLNYEAVMGNDQADRVQLWVDIFERYWTAPDTFDLTADLLAMLNRWLALVEPYAIYLKTVLAFVPEDRTAPPRPTYKMPVSYQRVLIERILRQMYQWQGAFLVASTGLGKTVIATHVAYRLKKEEQIINVMVFAPKAVHPDWSYAMKNAGLHAEIWTRDLLDQPPKQTKGDLMQMMQAIDLIDQHYLIIIDESQYFRNRTVSTGDRVRHSFQRLEHSIATKHPKVLLLTATPFAKDVDDVNNQLTLLPHTAPQTYQRPDGQLFMTDLVSAPATQAWSVPTDAQFFQAFTELPVATVISTSQVAKNFATRTPEGEYIDFGQHKKWFPRIEILRVPAPPPLEAEMSAVFAQRIFHHDLKSFPHRKGFRRTETSIETIAELAWMSSPLALKEVLQQTVNDTYKVSFKASTAQRKHILQPIIDRLTQLDPQSDAKLQVLIKIARQAHQQGQKVLVFTERLSTAVYLERELLAQLPAIRCASTVYQKLDGSYDLKDFEREALPIIQGFAPQANHDQIADPETITAYDLLIATDAFSAGVNLQDASIVVNFDLAWTPDVLIQRIGRVLRLWSEPRRISLYLFTPTQMTLWAHQSKANHVHRRLQQLVARTREAEKFSEIPIMPEDDQVTYETLGDLASVQIENWGFADVEEIEEFSGVSPFLRHLAALQSNRATAEALANDISSAKMYPGKHPLIYLLLFYEQRYYWVIYNLDQGRLESYTEDAILALIECPPQQPIALIDPAVVEQSAQLAKKCWMQANNVSTPEQVERIAALYLLPEGAEPALHHQREEELG